MKRLGWLLAASLPGCLELNPEFVDRSAETDTEADTTAATTSSEGSSSGAPSCQADGYEPNDALGDATDANELGFSLSGSLDSFTDIDWYKGSASPDGVVELLARVTPDTLRACIYVGCDSTPDAPTIDKCSGVLATAPNGEPGCCGPGVASLEYSCNVGFNVTFHASVDDPTATACVPYDVEFGTL